MANEMIWQSQSGYLYSPELNMKFQKQAQPMVRFRQFCELKEAFGMHKGQSVNWLKVSNASAYGGSIAETDTIPETKVPLSWGTVTVDEYGLSIPFSFKLEALSEFDVNSIIRTSLLDDAVKVIDGCIEREFNKTPFRYVGTSSSTGTFSTNSAATVTNTSALNTTHIDEMVAYLEDLNVPGFGGLGGDYVFIGSPKTLKGMKSSMLSIYQYTELGLRNIAQGEIGKYNRVRFVQDNFACSYTYSASARTATAITWTKGVSKPGYLFGGPTVREAVALPEEIRLKVATDYGRSKGIAWYGMFGWGIEWSDATNARIIKWDSNA